MSPRCLFWPMWGTVNNKSLLLSECPITPLWLTMALEKARWLYWQCSDLSRIDTIPLSAALPTVRHRLDFFFSNHVGSPLVWWGEDEGWGKGNRVCFCGGWGVSKMVSKQTSAHALRGQMTGHSSPFTRSSRFWSQALLSSFSSRPTPLCLSHVLSHSITSTSPPPHSLSLSLLPDKASKAAGCWAG